MPASAVKPGRIHEIIGHAPVNDIAMVELPTQNAARIDVCLFDL